MWSRGWSRAIGRGRSRGTIGGAKGLVGLRLWGREIMVSYPVVVVPGKGFVAFGN